MAVATAEANVSNVCWKSVESPTTEFIKLFKLSFEKRPYEELYDLQRDPGQLNNIAQSPEYEKQKQKLVGVFEKEFGTTYETAAPFIPERPNY